MPSAIKNRVDIRVKIESGHTEGEIPDYHEWVYSGDIVFRDSLGRRNGGTCGWLVVKCNNPGCAARAIISSVDILDQIALPL